ncbi:MAG TPA: zinc-ribbon domain-containing protein [Ktedonobacteraceae bacterium]
MINCERCGKQIPDNAVICPSCGTVSSISRPSSASYGQNPPSSSISYEYSQGSGQQQGYAPQNEYSQGSGQQQSYAPPTNYPPQSSYPQPSYPPQSTYPPLPPTQYPPQSGYGQQMYMPQQAMIPPVVNINVATPLIAPVMNTSTNNGAIVTEVLLNIFLGTYGVGWLMAGETATGIILLICSLVLYWPILIVGSIFTLGTGLFCFIPLSVGALILNTVLLNNTIKRKSLYMMVPHMPQPQQYPRQ